MRTNLENKMVLSTKVSLTQIICETAIFMFLFVTQNADLVVVPFIFWMSLIVQVVAILYLTITKKMIINYYIRFYLLFVLYVGLSLIWSINREYTEVALLTMIEYALPILVVSSYIISENRLYRVIKIYLTTTLLNSTYLIFSSEIFNLRIYGDGSDSTILVSNWNANTVGLLMAYSFFFIYFLRSNGHRYIRAVPLIDYFLQAVFAFIIIFSGSRKALIVCIFFVGLSYLLSNKNKLFNVLKIGLILVLFYIAIMYIPIFYNYIGVRLEGLFGILTGEADSSSLIRLNMIQLGVQWFQEKPVLGYGFANYRSLYYQHLERSWHDTYSHNNYIEVLTGGGIIGLCIYYSRYIYLIKQTIQKHATTTGKFVLPLVIGLMIIETGLVDYYEYFAQFTLCLCFIICNLKDKSWG